jgi:hypothetical protein
VKIRVPALAALLVSAVAALAPLAYATPPDPAWIAGFWDDGDHDDVITRVTSDVGATEPYMASDGRPGHGVVDAPPRTDERPTRSRARSSSRPRAPPIF